MQQPRFANSRLADQGNQPRLVILHANVESLLKRTQLNIAADHAGGYPGYVIGALPERPGTGANNLVDGHRLVKAFHQDGL